MSPNQNATFHLVKLVLFIAATVYAIRAGINISVDDKLGLVYTYKAFALGFLFVLAVVVHKLVYTACGISKK